MSQQTLYNDLVVNGTLVAGQNSKASGIASIALGRLSTASGDYSNVAGGSNNTANGDYSNVAGGVSNAANRDSSNVAGGSNNTANGDSSNVAGGLFNAANGDYSNVAGGFSNTVSGDYSNVAGGHLNRASATYSNVAGGYFNTASGDYSSIAGGRRAKIPQAHSGAGVWADGQDRDHTSKGEHSCFLDFASGVYLRLPRFNGISSQAGNIGELKISGSNLYVCTGTNLWGRVAVTNF